MSQAIQYNSQRSTEPTSGKSFGVSFILHALLLLIAFLILIPNTPPVQDPPPPPIEEFLVDLDIPAFKQRAREIKEENKLIEFKAEEASMGTKGRAEEGEAAPDKEAAPPAPTPDPTPTPSPTPAPAQLPAPTKSSTPAPPKVISAPPISQRTQADIPTAKESPKSGTGTTTTNNTKTDAPGSKPTTANSPATGKPGPNAPGTGSPGSNGTNPNAPPGRTSGKDGNGTGTGTTGSGGGKTGGTDANEGEGNASTGTGAYDGSGDGVFGRKVVHRDLSATFKAVNQTGKAAIKICVNQAGIVTYAEIIAGETTIKDKTTLRNFLKAARNYRVQPDKSAPKEQCGKLTFKVDNTANGKLKSN